MLLLTLIVYLLGDPGSLFTTIKLTPIPVNLILWVLWELILLSFSYIICNDRTILFPWKRPGSPVQVVGQMLNARHLRTISQGLSYLPLMQVQTEAKEVKISRGGFRRCRMLCVYTCARMYKWSNTINYRWTRQRKLQSHTICPLVNRTNRYKYRIDPMVKCFCNFCFSCVLI